MATLVAAPPHSASPPQPRAGVPRPGSIGAVERDPVRFHRAPLLFAALCFAAGIALSRGCWLAPGWLLVASTLLGLAAALAAWRAPRLAPLPLLCLWLLIGWLAAELAPRPAPQTALRALAQARPVTLTGSITRIGPVERVLSQRPFAEDQMTEQMQSMDLRVTGAASNDAPLLPITGGARLSLYAPATAAVPSLPCGALVTVTATIRPPERYRDPGVWDSPAWMLGQGIGVVGSAKLEHLAVAASPPRPSLACLLHTWQTAASSRMVQFADHAADRPLPAWLTLTHDDAAMLAAMITGDRTYLGRQLRVGFERTGSFHLLVVSGLHLGIFAALVFGIGRRLRMARLPLTAVTLVLAFAYALFTGFGQPVQRAFAMVALYLAGRLLYRDRNRLNSLGFAALCLLALNPQALFDAGLQMTLLTVVAVAGIAVPLMERTTAPFLLASRALSISAMDAAFTPRLAHFRVTLRLLGEHLEPLLSRRPRRTLRAQSALARCVRALLLFADLCIVSTVIELVMALPMALYFHRITPLGLPVNLLVVPALTLLLPCALLTMATLLLAPHLAWLPAAATAALLHAVNAIVRLFSQSAFADWRLPGPSATMAAAALSLLLLAALAVRARIKLALPLALALLLAGTACVVLPRRFDRRPQSLEVTAIDVGQGDSLFLVTPDGHTLLVDAGGPTGGSASHGNFEIGEDVVSHYLWSRGLRRLDAVALTHAHSDHMGGLPAVLRNLRPRELWVGNNPPIPAYQQLLAEAASLGIRVRALHAGDRTSLGGAQIDVLAPGAGYQPGPTATNNDSLVLRVAYASHAALLEGDAEAPSEAAMLALPPAQLRADLLKVGHHGSRTSTTPAFLAQVAPRYAVISVGPYNSYHHPRWETLEKLEAEGALTWRTDLLGLSTFYLDATGVHPRHPD